MVDNYNYIVFVDFYYEAYMHFTSNCKTILSDLESHNFNLFAIEDTRTVLNALLKDNKGVDLFDKYMKDVQNKKELMFIILSLILENTSSFSVMEVLFLPKTSIFTKQLIVVRELSRLSDIVKYQLMNMEATKNNKDKTVMKIINGYIKYVIENLTKEMENNTTFSLNLNEGICDNRIKDLYCILNEIKRTEDESLRQDLFLKILFQNYSYLPIILYLIQVNDIDFKIVNEFLINKERNNTIAIQVHVILNRLIDENDHLLSQYITPNYIKVVRRILIEAIKVICKKYSNTFENIVGMALF